ncbi:MAG: hypothetical protein K9G24_01720 [Candidatus Nanopelagicales bacterium]|nr:hypothetical protein [Candidatus Nanopelagicales bacterium]MCF8536794.1 hypothetical protein [Candidatus Nanopelagicales bacterium]MCF8541779.1 hypothetical protein [Candidatus Nanopelagicales bacterium]MCF8556180.1 hypothetical protein [Candidatus Nanopelagicales bacterium]
MQQDEGNSPPSGAGLASRWAAPALAAGGALVVIALAYGVFSEWHILQADLSTYLLPGVARQRDQGTVYVDFFDIKPPLAYAMFLPWLALFGHGLAGMWVLYALLLASMFAGFWLVLRRLLDPWPALYVFSACCLSVVGLSLLEELFFVTETVCLVLVLCGLALALRLGSRPAWLIASAALVASAGQVKEVFILAPLALLPVASRFPRGWLRGVLCIAAGSVAAILAVGGALVLWGGGALGGYLEVLGFKREKFPAPTLSRIASDLPHYLATVRDWFPWLGLLVVIVVGLLVWRLLSHRGINPLVGDRQVAAASVIILFASVAIGMLWQGAPPIRHYALALVLPAYLLAGAALAWVQSCVTPIARPWRTLIVILTFATAAPAVSSVAWSYGRVRTFDPLSFVESASSLESESDLSVFRKIADLTPTDQCIQAAYGWSATAYYVYAARPSCSRFVVPPLALDPAYRQQMQDDLVRNPPAVLVLDEAVRGETALLPSIGTPEEIIFPFEAVTERCYQPVASFPTLFVPIEPDRTATGACIREQIDRVVRPEPISGA